MRLTILLILIASPVMADDAAHDMWRSPMWNDAMSSPMWNTDTSSINTRAFNSGFRLGYQSTVQRKTDSLVRPLAPLPPIAPLPNIRSGTRGDFERGYLIGQARGDRKTRSPSP
jgi:hypothetical protein